jgi:hypothetical protein
MAPEELEEDAAIVEGLLSGQTAEVGLSTSRSKVHMAAGGA